MKNKNNKAFTLIELLVALAVFAIVAAGIYKTLSGGVKIWSRHNAIIGENQRSRVFIDNILSDCANAVNFFNPGVPPPVWADKSISFFTVINIYEDKQMRGEFAKVTYRLESGNLLRSYVLAKDGFDEKCAKKNIFLTGLQSLRFEYPYNDPVSLSDPGALPKALKVYADRLEKLVLIPVGNIKKEDA